MVLLYGSPATKKASSSSLLRILKKIVLFLLLLLGVRAREGKARRQDVFDYRIDIVNNESNRFYGEIFKI